MQFVEQLPHLERETIERGKNSLRIPAQTQAAARKNLTAAGTCPASGPAQPPCLQHARGIQDRARLASSHLAEDDGRQEEVEQQRFGQMAVVQGEEEDGEEDGDVLVSRTAVGGAKQLQARHRDHQSAHPAGEDKHDCTRVRGPSFVSKLLLFRC